MRYFKRENAITATIKPKLLSFHTSLEEQKKF